MACKRKLSILSGGMAALVIFASTPYANPPAPVPVSPLNGASNQDTTRIIFMWNPIAPPFPSGSFYKLDVSADNFSTSWTGFPHTRSGGINDTKDTATIGFASNTVYYWRVYSDTGGLPSAWSSTFVCTTQVIPPAAPVLASPSNNATFITPSTSVGWNAVSGTVPVTYRLQVSIDPSFATTSYDNAALTTTSTAPGFPDQGRTYYWRVNATNSAGTGPWSSVWRLHTTQETYAGVWPYSKKLYLNTKATSGGANIRNAVSNFPLLVRLIPNSFGWFNQTQDSGKDIRFSDGTTPLPYEIERWVDISGDNDTAEIWVRLNTVNALDSIQSITMYWGNSSATGRSSPYDVFDTATGFAGVWHMNAAVSGSDTIVKDRTLTLCNGMPKKDGFGGWGDLASVAGVVGKALWFNTSNPPWPDTGFLSLSTISKTVFDTGKGITVSAWVNDSVLTNNARIVDVSEDGSRNKISLGTTGTSTTLGWAAGSENASVASYLLTGTFYHVCAVYTHHAGANGDSVIVYKNGTIKGSSWYTYAAGTTPFVTPLSDKAANFVAKNAVSGNGLFMGVIDELEMSKVARDSNWIKLAYQTQRTDETALCYPPSIAQPPHDTNVQFGDTARFSVVARGNNLQYLWQRSDNSGAWYTAPGTAANAQYKYKTLPADTGLTSVRFRCKAYTPNDSAWSAAATLTICVPTILKSTWPHDISGFVGETATFDVVDSQVKSPTNVWQRNKSNSGWLTAPAPNTNSSYSYTPDSTDTNVQFRCQVTGMSGACQSIALSRAASLTLCWHVTISQQPAAKDSVTDSSSALFHVKATAGKQTPLLTYRWWKKPNGGGWQLATVGTYTDTNYIFQALPGDDLSRYFCVIQNSVSACAESKASDSVTLGLLRVCTRPQIDTNPVTITVAVGQTATFHIAAHGSALGYQWQRSNDGGSTYHDTTGTGATTPTFSFTVTNDTGSSIKFRCHVTGVCGNSVYSQGASVAGCVPAAIATQPSPQSAMEDSSATFRVTATGSNPTYQWQKRPKSGSWGDIAGAVGSSYPLPVVLPADSGSWFKCRVSTIAPCLNTVTSDSALLMVYTREAISNPAYPLDVTVPGGDPTSFSISVTGSGSPTYQWERSRDGGTNWVPITASTPIIGHYGGFTTNTLTLNPTDTLDTNALFHCVVTGHYGSLPTTSVTSRAAKLTLCYVPVIDVQPQNQNNIPPGDFATFSVHAVPFGSLSYQWEQSAPPYSSWTVIPGAIGNTYTFPTMVGLNNYRYHCKVWSGSCTGNAAVSSWATLTVCALPNIDTQPANEYVIEGDTARFNLAVTGTNLLYQWQRKKSTSTTWSPTGDITSTVIIPGVDTTYNDYYYRCKITASCDPTAPVTSDSVLLTVFLRAHAYFDMSVNVSGPWDTTISDTMHTIFFNDTSYGDINQCTWNFGDSTHDTTVAKRNGGIPMVHTYPSVSTQAYSVRLVVSGNGGRDTIWRKVIVYPASGNPIIIRGQYLADTLVELTLANYKSLRSGAPSPYVLDSGIRLWYMAGSSLPADTLPPVSLLKTYSLDSLKARDSTTYRDTVKVPRNTTWYSFMTRLHWDIGYTTPPFDSGNGCRVLMRDTLPPPNKLRLTGEFLPWDTVVFKFIDTYIALDKVDTVRRWWGLQGSPVDFSDIAHTKWWPADTVIKHSVDTTIYGSPTGMFLDTVKNAVFNTPVRKMFTIVVRRCSKNNNKNSDDTFNLMIGRTPPKTPIRLEAEAQSATVVHLTWKWDTLICYPDSVRVDSFRIWYAADTAVPLQAVFDTTMYKRVRPEPAIGSGEAFVYNLQEQTWYHFGAQMYLGRGSVQKLDFQAGLWSEVTPTSPEFCYSYWDTIKGVNVDVYDTMRSIDSVVTPRTADSFHIPNRVRIDTPVVFTTTTNTMKINWHVNRMGYTNLILGISYSLRNGRTKSAAIAAEQPSSGMITIPNLSSDTGSYTINLDGTGSLVFDTTYYVFLWLDRSGERWSSPTDSSTGTCYVPPFIWQTTRYHFYTYKADTSYWVNGTVRFITSPSMRDEDFQAKIHAYSPLLPTVKGFVDTLGQSFYFMDQGMTDQSFYVGLKCSVPFPSALKDVRVYRFDNVNNVWLVNRNTLIDTASSTAQISVKPIDASLINNLSAPFIAMIDTQPPHITWLDSTDTMPKREHAPVLDNMAIFDNVGNLHWTFRAARGGESFPALPFGGSDSGTLTTGLGTIATSIDTMLVNTATGPFLLFIADDGRFYDTLNLSRRVLGISNTVYTTQMQWYPLQVKVDLDSPAVSRLWQYVEKANGTYDNRYIRLFRFKPDPSNASKPVNEKWLEYAAGAGLDTIFALTAGKLLWVKTRVSDGLKLGHATTRSLLKPDTITLNAMGWTDFSLPFNFDLRIGDILNANDTSALNLQFYQWITTTQGNYQTNNCFLDCITELDSMAKVMDHSEQTGFAVFNLAAQTVRLIIPPISAVLSPYNPSPVGKKAAKTTAGRTGRGGWTLKLLPKTGAGMTLRPVYCGYDTAGGHTVLPYPMPPTFGNFSVGVCDEQTGAMNAHRILHAMRNGGCSYLVAFQNDSSAAQNVSVKVGRVAGFTPAMKTALYDQSTGRTVELANTNEATITVEGQTTEHRWLLVGDANYIASALKVLPVMRLALDRAYPNPVRNLVRLRYVVPFELARVEFNIFNISGRTIWHQTIEERTPLGGSRECQWSATTTAGQRVGAGIYIVKMAGFNKKGSMVGTFNQLLTVLP